MTEASWWAVTTENWSSENCSATWSTALDSGGAILYLIAASFRDGFRQLGGLVPELVEGACERHAWMVSLGGRSRKRTPRPPTKRLKAASGFSTECTGEVPTHTVIGTLT